MSDAISKLELNKLCRECKAGDYPENKKNNNNNKKLVYTLGFGAHLVSARKQGLDLVLEHWRRPLIRAWVLKKIPTCVFTLVPSEYHTPSPCTGTKCGRCHSVLFGPLYTEYHHPTIQKCPNNIDPSCILQHCGTSI